MNAISLTATFCALFLGLLVGVVSADPFVPLKPEAVVKQDIFTALGKVQVSLDDAIKAAEKTVFGQTIKAELSYDSSPPVYRVAIADVNSRTITFIKVDAGTGNVLSSRVVHPGHKGNRHKPTHFPAASAGKP